MTTKEGTMLLAWLDLETTGHDTPAEGSVLELGLVVTTLELNELARADWLVEPDLWHVATMPKVVRRMHTDNGLLADLDYHRARQARYPDRVVEPAAQVDHQVAAVLDRVAVDEGKLVLAGSGVSHYDRPWLNHHFPEVASRLRYYTLDVGVVRRFLGMLLGRDDLVAERPQPDAKAHRALADAVDHVHEAGWYRDLLHDALEHAEPVGARVKDGGVMGTLVRCGECGGSGRLHAPDELPPVVQPEDPSPCCPWHGRGGEPETPCHGGACPDGGACYHECMASCWRVRNAAPLAGAFPADVWPAEVRQRHAPDQRGRA